MSEQINQQAPPVAPTPEAKSNHWTVQRIVMIAAAALGGLIALIFIIGLLFALFSNVDATAARMQIIKDIFIIIIALEFILIVGAFAILVVQIARMVNLLQTEVKPVLENTQDAVNSAKGTVEFVGNNVTQPVVKVGAFLAGARIFVREAGGIRRAIRPNGEVKQIELD